MVGILEDKDRIFTNLYGLRDWRLEGARQRGAWNATADMLEGTDAAPDLILELRIDAASLDAGEWTSAQSKKHFSRSRSTQRGRKANFEKPIEPDQ